MAAKRNIFLVLLISIGAILLEIVMNIPHLILFGLSILLMILSLFIGRAIYCRLVLFIGLFGLVLSVVLTKSILIFIFSLVAIALLFRTEEGNSLVNTDDRYVHPFRRGNSYQSIQGVQGQEKQLSRDRQPLSASFNSDQMLFLWDDVNLVYFGGNNIIDLGQAILPEGETVILIRKVFGQTRIIIPSQIPYRLSYSTLSGQLIHRGESVDLVHETYLYQCPTYIQNQSGIRLVISSVFGQLELVEL